MSFTLKCDESVEAGFQRLLIKQLDRARSSLQPASHGKEEAIHDARKSLKKVRALLRLVRSELGEAAYRRWNATARDTARWISPARDAQVLVATLDKLTEAYADSLAPNAFRLPRAVLSRVRREASTPPAGNRTLSKVRGDLGRLRAAVVKTHLPNPGWKAVEPNLERVYRQGRRAFRAAYDAPGDVAFHEWRKQSKYLRHQIDVLRDTWSEPLAELSDQLHALSDLLGEDHDLVMLRERVQKDPERFGSPETVRALYALIERRMEFLRQEARPLGERLYVEKPRAFARRLHGYWQSWHRPRPTPQPMPSLLLTA